MQELKLILLHITILWVAVCFSPQGAKKRAGALFTIGAVGRCLSKALVQAKALAPKCRELVLIAAPKDSRVYLQYPESTSALVTKIAELQRAAGGWSAGRLTGSDCGGGWGGKGCLGQDRLACCDVVEGSHRLSMRRGLA